MMPDVTAQQSDFSREEVLRYSRHLLIPQVGLEGQLKLKASSALVDRHRRAGLAAGHVPGRRRGRQASAWWITT